MIGGLMDKISVLEFNSSRDEYDAGDGNCCCGCGCGCGCDCWGLTCIIEFVVDTRKLIISELTGCLANIFNASLSDIVDVNVIIGVWMWWYWDGKNYTVGWCQVVQGELSMLQIRL